MVYLIVGRFVMQQIRQAFLANIAGLILLLSMVGLVDCYLGFLDVDPPDVR